MTRRGAALTGFLLMMIGAVFWATCGGPPHRKPRTGMDAPASETPMPRVTASAPAQSTKVQDASVKEDLSTVFAGFAEAVDRGLRIGSGADKADLETPRRILLWAQGYPAGFKRYVESRPELASVLVATLASMAAAEAESEWSSLLLDAVPEGRRAVYINTMVNVVSETDATAAARWVADSSRFGISSIAVESASAALAAGNPDNIAAWLKDLPQSENRVSAYAAAFRQLTADSPPKALERLSALSAGGQIDKSSLEAAYMGVIGVLAASDADAALKVAGLIKDDRLRQTAMDLLRRFEVSVVPH